MDADRIASTLKAVTSDLTGLHVKSLSLFGSAARGSVSQQSDLDFLVEFEGPATFDQYMSLKELLEATFDRRIDLVTLRSIKPVLRETVLSEAVKVA